MNATEYTIEQSAEVQEIIVQLESCKFKDKHGHKLEMSTSFADLKKIASGKRNLEIRKGEAMSMGKFIIDKDIPIPVVATRDTNGFPIDDMAVGDSFVCSLLERNRLSAAINYRNKKGIPIKILTRKINDTEMRVWLIK